MHRRRIVVAVVSAILTFSCGGRVEPESTATETQASSKDVCCNDNSDCSNGTRCGDWDDVTDPVDRVARAFVCRGEGYLQHCR
jgi:hypothetical protein